MPEKKVLRPRGAQPGNHNALKHGFYAAARPQERESDHPIIRRLQKVGRAIDDTRDKIMVAINKDPETAAALSDALAELARLSQEELDCLNDLRREALRIRMRKQLNNPRLTLLTHPP